MGSAMARSMEHQTIVVYKASHWPPMLEARLGDSPPTRVAAIGDLGMLGRALVGFFCSRRCPGDLILRAYDWARDVRGGDAAVISGFHSIIEKDCLDILLRGTCPIIICPARGIDRMRIPRDWRKPIGEGRLLLLSSFPASAKRATATTCDQRNRFVAQLADEIIFAYADPGGKTDASRRCAVGQGRQSSCL